MRAIRCCLQFSSLGLFALLLSGSFVMAQQPAQTQTEKSSAAQNHATQDRAAPVRAVLLKQRDAWNDGDIDKFMETYWKSEDLTFSSGGKTTRGWQATLDRYKANYQTRQDMGTLTFGNLQTTMLGDEAALVLGEWNLDRGEPIGGNFSLVLRKIDGAWVIIHDHTSVTPADE